MTSELPLSMRELLLSMRELLSLKNVKNVRTADLKAQGRGVCAGLYVRHTVRYTVRHTVRHTTVGTPLSVHHCRYLIPGLYPRVLNTSPQPGNNLFNPGITTILHFLARKWENVQDLWAFSWGLRSLFTVIHRYSGRRRTSYPLVSPRV